MKSEVKSVNTMKSLLIDHMTCCLVDMNNDNDEQPSYFVYDQD